MHFFSFWKTWPPVYRNIWYVLALIFVFSTVNYWVTIYMGPNAIIEWERIQEQKTIETIAHSFRLGPFNLNVPAESYVIFEYLSGSHVSHNFTATGIFLILFSFSVSVLLAIGTTMDRLWYFASITVFIVLMVTLRLEVLEMFKRTDMVVPLVIMGLYVLLSFYFKYFGTGKSLLARLAAFLGLTLAVAACIFSFAGVTYPSLHLMVTSFTPALILTVIFIILVAHEILVTFLYIARQDKQDTAAKHFTIISFIYLLYVIITALHEIGVVTWDLIYINVYLLLFISGVLGVWGYRLREPVYENLFPFRPLGSYFYLALGSIAFATVAQIVGNWNDPAIKVITDITYFAHAGFGVIFLLYFLSNFLPMMGRNIAVFPVLYKPSRMPYFTFRFAGLIVMLAFVFYSHWRDYIFRSAAAIYNYAADLYLYQGDEKFAMTFYDQSANRSSGSNRANYALGKLRSERFDVERAAENYDISNRRNPTEFSLVNEGNLNFWADLPFDAIKAFKAGLERMPGSAVLKNNLGYSFAKVHALDSASFYLTEARKSDLTKNSAETNFFALAAVEFIPINTDSVLTIFESDSRAVSANAMALSTLFGQTIKTPLDPLAVKRDLDLYSATYMHNYIIRNVRTLDTAWISQAYKISSYTTNLAFREALKAALAHAYYYKGNVYKALEILGELAYITQNYAGQFNYTMGLWALEQGDPAFAAVYFKYAAEADYKQGRFYRTIALTESGNLEEALPAWDSLAISDDENVRKLASQLLTILRATPAQALNFADGPKYQFCRYRLTLRDTATLNKFIPTIQHDNYKAQLFLDYARKFYEAGEVIPAIRFLRRISGLQITDETLYNDARYLELQMLASRGEMRLLADQINKGITFDDKHILDKMLYTALMNEVSGDTTNATRNYELLGNANPFFEDGIIAAARFFSGRKPGSMKSYEMLTDAIYINTRSARLLQAYIAEARKIGFDEYADSAAETLRQIQTGIR